MSSSISELSNREKQLLQLVHSGVTASKELAKATGLTPGYVDKALSQAAKKLSAPDRITAASRYSMSLQVSDLRSDRRTPVLHNKSNPGSSHGTSASKRVLRMIIMFLRGPPLGGEQHTLRWDQITLQIIRVAAIGLVSITTLVLFILGFFRTFS